ncbi:MAG TPA: hypothetical protein VKU39_01400, partial [Streptosporangiaceae bacterium]|nr:hypothetical protein [Streptosporangiaceae bacterium]
RAVAVFGNYGPSGVSCHSATLCVAFDSSGRVAASSNPAGGPAAWKISRIDGHRLLAAVDCAGMCVAIDNQGNAMTSARPASGERRWAFAHVDGYQLTAATCPSASLCVASDGYGRIAIARP